MHEHVIGVRNTVASSGQGSVSQVIVHMLDRLLFAMEVRRQRRALADLDACALKDVGITRAEAGVESSRGFWDLPVQR